MKLIVTANTRFFDMNRFLYGTEKNLVIALPVQNLLKDFDFDAGVTVRVEVDVLVE